MVKKNYTVTLDEEIMDESLSKLVVGQKLSPVINDLLKKWNKTKVKRDEEENIN